LTYLFVPDVFNVSPSPGPDRVNRIGHLKTTLNEYYIRWERDFSSLEKPETLAEWIVIVQPFDPFAYARQKDGRGDE
jgi:hypothetical protein